MSHQLDFDGMAEKLILLQHFSSGSRSYCADRLTGSTSDQGAGALDDYWGWVKTIVCNYSIDCAIKFRILQDTIKGQSDVVAFEQLDSQAQTGLTIGLVAQGTFDLTLRESCNKIIHARRVIPQWLDSRAKGKRFKYWNGTVEYGGDRGGKKWIVILNVSDWSRAMERFLLEFQSSDAFHYVGQDWY